jgi:serine protease Do
MKAKNGLIAGGLLLALGAGTAWTVSHVTVAWGPRAAAAPGIVGAEVKPALPPPSPTQLADARSLSRTYAQVAAQVSPSVVRINITKTAKNVGGMGNRFRGTPFEHFFGGDDDDGPFGHNMPAPKQKGMGSGVVIDGKGHILTNNHVVEGADDVQVHFLDGKTVKGKVIGTDPKSDLAVVKVDGVDVRPARLGDSDRMQVGESVMAIGNPFGLDHTVTVGVLSAKNRSTGGSGYQDFLQTDASINPGNSGGPLVNLDGEVIGINTMILGPAGNIGIGFAVPSSMAKPIADQLIQGGKVRRPYLGILMQDMTPELRQSMMSNKGPEKGALVSNVQPGSPAEKAGVKPGDVILSVEGAPVDGSKAVQRTVLSKKIGQKLDLTVWRDGKDMKLAATTAELPGDDKMASAGGSDSKSAAKAKLGLQLQPLTPELAERLGVGRNERGVVVAGVKDGGPAAEAGVREGDLIVSVDQKPVSSVDEAARLLTQERPGGHLLRVRRGDGAIFVVIPSA